MNEVDGISRILVASRQNPMYRGKVRKVSDRYSGAVAAAVCAGSGLCVSFCFWPYRTGFLAYVVVIPFILFSGLGTGRGRFLLNSFVFGIGYFMGSLYWIAMLEPEQITLPWLRLPAAIVLAVYLSLFMLFAGFLTRRLVVLRIPYEIALALAWAAVEYLRSLGPLGFPWASLAYSQTPYLPVIQQASIVGTCGLSAWLVLINGLLSRFVLYRQTRILAAGALVFAGPVIWGQIVVQRAQDDETLRLSLVQPNISGTVKWDQAYADSTMRLLAQMTVEARGSQMVVWPETAVPFHLKRMPSSLDEVSALAKHVRSHILLGFPDYEETDNELRFYNSAMLVERSGDVAGEYRKIHLVPFGEMIPFEDRIALLRGIDLGEGDFSPGEQYTIFEIDGRRFAVAICFESIYPGLVGRFVESGATFIVNITNDEWFGPSLGPYQHAQMAVMRCVEFRVGLARCANTGISMFVDPYGRITSRTEIFSRQILSGQVAIGSGKTPYLRVGRSLEAGLLLVVLGLAVASYLGRRCWVQML